LWIVTSSRREEVLAVRHGTPFSWDSELASESPGLLAYFHFIGLWGVNYVASLSAEVISDRLLPLFGKRGVRTGIHLQADLLVWGQVRNYGADAWNFLHGRGTLLALHTHCPLVIELSPFFALPSLGFNPIAGCLYITPFSFQLGGLATVALLGEEAETMTEVCSEFQKQAQVS